MCERNIDWHNIMCPDWESNQQPFGWQAQSTEPHQPGKVLFIFMTIYFSQLPIFFSQSFAFLIILISFLKAFTNISNYYKLFQLFFCYLEFLGVLILFQLAFTYGAHFSDAFYFEHIFSGLLKSLSPRPGGLAGPSLWEWPFRYCVALVTCAGISLTWGALH